MTEIPGRARSFVAFRSETGKHSAAEMLERARERSAHDETEHFIFDLAVAFWKPIFLCVSNIELNSKRTKLDFS